MIWGKTNKQKELPKLKHWFAWYPVELKDGHWVWLEWLCKKEVLYGCPKWEYSLSTDRMFQVFGNFIH